MHVTACLAGQKVEVEVGEDCRTVQALREAIVKELPQLCAEGFDVSVGGRALDDEGIVSLEEHVCLDVSANTRGLSVLALHEAGREVSEAGLLEAASERDASLCTLYLDAGVAIDCVDSDGYTPLQISCSSDDLVVATLLLDRGSTAIDEKDSIGWTPLHLTCCNGSLKIATLLLDRGSNTIDEKDRLGRTPLFISCNFGNLEIATLLLDRGSTAIDEKNRAGVTPFVRACRSGAVPQVTLLLDRGCSVDVGSYKTNGRLFPQQILELLSERGHALPDPVP